MDSITMTTEQQLPEGWEYAPFNMFFNVVSISDKKISQKEYLDNGKYPVIDQGNLFIGGYSNDESLILKISSPVIVFGDHTKCFKYVSFPFVAGADGIKVLEPQNGIYPKYAYYYCLSIDLTDRGYSRHFAFLKKCQFLIAPLETQQAIVNKIESLFDEIDEGIGRLKTAARQIQQYRQSLLKNAFNGELTKEWRSKHADTLPSENELLAQIQTTREQHHAQQLADWQTAVSQWEQNGKEGKKPSKPKAPTQAVKFEENFADLPKGWGTIKINQVAEIFTGATPLKSNANYYENGSIPWVTSGSLNNEFVDSADSFVTDLALKETNLKLLPKHTLLVAMYGEGKTRGKCSELLIEATTNQAIAGIVLNDRYPISRKFLKFYMFKNYADIRRQSSGGVQPNLNLGLVGNIIFPLPCLAEQTQIVAILESKLTACDQLADELAKQLKQAELLKQAVLKVAFSGGLLDK